MYCSNSNKASVIYKQDTAFARFHLWIFVPCMEFFK